MADCSEFLANLSEYVDGRLERRASRRLEVHLRRCGRCRSAVAALRRGVAELQAGDEVEPSPFFKAKLAERLQKEVRIGDPIQPTSAGLAAAVLIGVAVGLALLQPIIHRAADVPVVAERPQTTDPFDGTGIRVAAERDPDFLPWVFPDVTLAFTHARPVFSSHPRVVGTLALLAH